MNEGTIADKEIGANVDETFQRFRPLLFTIARRILGSSEEAEDIIQETYMRWARATAETIESPKHLLTTITTRLCINHLNSARVRRERPAGLEFLPEERMAPAPFRDEDALAAAFDILFETLAPMERAAFLLREVFEFSYEQIAAFIDKTPTNCRQIVKRGRDRILARIPRGDDSGLNQHDRLLEAFTRSSSDGDLGEMLRVLADDITENSERTEFSGAPPFPRAPGFHTVKSGRLHNAIVLEKLAADIGQAALGLMKKDAGISGTAFALALISSRLLGSALELEELLKVAQANLADRN